MFMWVILGALFVAILIIVCVCLINDKNYISRCEKINSEHFLLNSRKVLEENGFVVDKLYLFKTYLKYSMINNDNKTFINTYGVLIDKGNKKLALIDIEDCKCYLLSFENIISYEIIKNGNQVISGKSGDAFLGGLLLGTTGAIIGASGQKTIDNFINEIKFVINTKNIEVPNFVMNFIENVSGVAKLKTDGEVMQKIQQQVLELKSIIELVLNSKD